MADEVPTTMGGALRIWITYIALGFVLSGVVLMVEKDPPNYVLGTILVVAALPLLVLVALWDAVSPKISLPWLTYMRLLSADWRSWTTITLAVIIVETFSEGRAGRLSHDTLALIGDVCIFIVAGLAASFVTGSPKKRPAVPTQTASLVKVHQQTPGALFNALADHKTIPEEERIVIDVSPEYLMSFFSDHVDVQAAKLAQPYLGKWIRAGGPISNVSSLGTHQTAVSVRHPDIDYFSMRFDNRWRDRLSVLKRGDQISVIGKIYEIAGWEIILENCELITSTGP